MKRSSGVTAAAIAMIVARSLAAVGAAFPLVTGAIMRFAEPFAASVTGSLTRVTATALCGAVWGIAAGIGLLDRRHWAWLSALTIAALLVLVSIGPLAAAPHLCAHLAAAFRAPAPSPSSPLQIS